MRIVIYVEGGVVQSVYSNLAPSVVLIDADNLFEEGYDREHIESILEAETENCDELYVDGPEEDSKCDECGTFVPLIIGCPDGKELCVTCFNL